MPLVSAVRVRSWSMSCPKAANKNVMSVRCGLGVSLWTRAEMDLGLGSGNPVMLVLIDLIPEKRVYALKTYSFLTIIMIRATVSLCTKKRLNKHHQVWKYAIICTRKLNLCIWTMDMWNTNGIVKKNHDQTLKL